ncbi:unnamed protein product [Amaranthus hypochondriacus]
MNRLHQYGIPPSPRPPISGTAFRLPTTSVSMVNPKPTGPTKHPYETQKTRTFHQQPVIHQALQNSIFQKTPPLRLPSKRTTANTSRAPHRRCRRKLQKNPNRQAHETPGKPKNGRPKREENLHGIKLRPTTAAIPTLHSPIRQIQGKLTRYQTPARNKIERQPTQPRSQHQNQNTNKDEIEDSKNPSTDTKSQHPNARNASSGQKQHPEPVKSSRNKRGERKTTI